MPHDFLNPTHGSQTQPVSRPRETCPSSDGVCFRGKMPGLLLILATAFALMLPVAEAGPLTGARITHIINDVKTVIPEKPSRPATLNEQVEPGAAVRTGIDSRTELLFSDRTITRLGANSQFTVNEGTREISLSKGVILLQVPKGSGGAKIQTSAVTAAVTGTTILFEVVGGFTRLTVLEGTCILVLRNDLLNRKTTVTSGQQVRFSNTATEIPTPRRIKLSAIFKSSVLLVGTWGVQLDQTYLAAALAAQEGIDFGGIGTLKVKGIILLNKKPAKNGDIVHTGDIIETTDDLTAIIIVTGGGEIFIGKLTRVRVSGGGNDPVITTTLFGTVKTFGLGNIDDDPGDSGWDTLPYFPALGFGNTAGTSNGGGGSSASGGVVTVAQPNGQIFIFDSFGRFIRVQ